MGEALSFTARITHDSKKRGTFKINIPSAVPKEKIERFVGKEVIVIVYEKDDIRR